MAFRACLQVALTSVSLVVLCAAAAAANPLGPQSALILPIGLDTEVPSDDVRRLVNETDRLLRWNSSGRTWLEPTYAPTFCPQHGPKAYRDLAGLRILRREALDAVAHLPRLRQYRRLILVLPPEFAGQPSVGTVGYELVQCRQDDFYATTAWVRPHGTPLEAARVLLHELGHNFGFSHHEGCMDAHRTGDAYSSSDRLGVGWPAQPTGGALVRR